MKAQSSIYLQFMKYGVVFTTIMDFFKFMDQKVNDLFVAKSTDFTDILLLCLITVILVHIKVSYTILIV